jgi:hypothetical protein
MKQRQSNFIFGTLFKKIFPLHEGMAATESPAAFATFIIPGPFLIAIALGGLRFADAS